MRFEAAGAEHAHPGQVELEAGQDLSTSTRGWLKQLDWVAGRIVEHDLLPTRTGDHVAPESHARLAQPSDFRGDVIYQQVNAIPPAWARLPTVGHGTSRRARAAAEQQPQTAAFRVGEGWPKIGQNGEPEMRRIEMQRGRDVVNHVPHVNGVSVMNHLI
jgi:hypothetical protein